MVTRTVFKDGTVVFSGTVLVGFNPLQVSTVTLQDALDELQEAREVHDAYPVADADEYEQIVSGNHNDFDVVEEGAWEQEGKYQWRSIIVRHKASGLHYEGYESRSGSPFTSWHYEYDVRPLTPVEKTVKVIEEWG